MNCLGKKLIWNTRNIRTEIGNEQPVIGNSLICIICGNLGDSKENCPKYGVSVENNARGTYKIVEGTCILKGKIICPSGLIKILFILFVNTKDPS